MKNSSPVTSLSSRIELRRHRAAVMLTDPSNDVLSSAVIPLRRVPPVLRPRGRLLSVSSSLIVRRTRLSPVGRPSISGRCCPCLDRTTALCQVCTVPNTRFLQSSEDLSFQPLLLRLNMWRRMTIYCLLYRVQRPDLQRSLSSHHYPIHAQTI